MAATSRWARTVRKPCIATDRLISHYQPNGYQFDTIPALMHQDPILP